MSDGLASLSQRRFEELCEQYSGSLPRYTSYPTAVELKPVESGLGEVEESLSQAFKNQNGLSLYVHIPYCPKLCYFCACNKVIGPTPEEKDEYQGYLRKEAELLRALNGGDPILAKQIHLGGGSPSYLSPEQFLEVEQIFQENFHQASEIEKSVELDPRNTTPELLDVIQRSNYRRASIGVQDFDPLVQELINRIQPYDMTAELTNELRSRDVSSVNFDLIYGLPGQTAKGFQKTIEQVVELKPDRIALYGYAHVKWKVKVQNVFQKYPLPTPKERIHLFASAVELLHEAGYKYIGMDHFALPNDELFQAFKQRSLRRNFMGYTTVAGIGVLGMGASAISDLNGVLHQNAVAVDGYKERLNAGSLPVGKTLFRSEDDLIRSFIIEQLMSAGSVSVEECLSQAELPKDSTLYQAVFNDARIRMEPYVSEGFARWPNESELEITELGSFFMRHVASCFDIYLLKKVANEGPRFSQSI